MDALLWFLLPVAAISGWIAAFKHFKSISNNRLPDVYDASFIKRSESTNNSNGIGHVDACGKRIDNFADTQPDKAVDIVIDKVEVNSDTVEVHLALGNLYRRSGEVNRAIRFHQNLSEKHALSHPQRESILFELGRDYLSAGLLDRAERIFKDLLTTDEFKIKSSKALVEVFQQEKDWDAAIEYAEMYERLSKKSQKIRIAHYYCEKAEKLAAVFASLTDTESTKKDEGKVKALLNLALKKDKACVRANILLGDISSASSEYGVALKYYLLAVEQDRTFLSLVFDSLIKCAELSAKNTITETVLPVSSDIDANAKAIPSLEFGREVSLLSQKCLRQKKMQKYIKQQLDKAPTMSLLGKYLQFSLDDPELLDRKKTVQLKSALLQILKKNASYKCVSCGLGVHALQWQCPSCSNWSTIKPQ